MCSRGSRSQSPVSFLDELRGGNEQAVGRVGDRCHRRHQLGVLSVEVVQCFDSAVRAFRQAGAITGYDAAGGGDCVDEIGLAVLRGARYAWGAAPRAFVSGGVSLRARAASNESSCLPCPRLRLCPVRVAYRSACRLRPSRPRTFQRPVKHYDGVRVRVGVDSGPHHSVRRRRSFSCIGCLPRLTAQTGR